MASEFSKVFPKPEYDADMSEAEKLRLSRDWHYARIGALWALKWIYETDWETYTDMLSVVRKEIDAIEKE